MTEEQKPAFLTFLTYGILFANDLVCDEIALAYNKTKTHPIFRHRVKQLAKKLYRESIHYKAWVRQTVGEQNNVYLSDCNAVFNDNTENYVQTLHIAAKSILDRHRVEHSNIIAHWCLIHDLCHIALAKVANATRLATENKVTIRLSPRLSIAHIEQSAREIKQALYHGPTIDFNNDANYGNSLKVLTNKLCDSSIITKAICID